MRRTTPRATAWMRSCWRDWAESPPRCSKPIVHRGVDARRDRMLVQARDGFVRARTQLVNQVRGLAKALGARLPTSSTEAFARRVRATTPPDLFPGLEPLLDTIEHLTRTTGSSIARWSGDAGSATRRPRCCARCPAWVR